jgi:DDE superfamily endonuclease
VARPAGHDRELRCVVTVPRGLARGDFHRRRDGARFLPESWDADRDRGREAGIPDDVVDRPPWQSAWERDDRAVSNRLRFDWLTLDAGHGGTPALVRALATRTPRCVAAVLRGCAGGLDPPRGVTRPDHQNRRGRGRNVPRLASGRRPARRVEERRDDPRPRDQPWPRFRVQEGAKGPMVWGVQARDADRHGGRRRAG